MIEGVKSVEHFDVKIEFGQMWHACEEAFAKSGNSIVNNPVATAPWLRALIDYAKGLVKKYPTDQPLIDHWYMVCRTQFPLYIEYWAKNPDILNRTPLLQEQTFDVPYTLPNGVTIRLRGKWDSVDLVEEGKKPGIYLQENKTKSRINEGQLKRQLGFDLQTMLYLTALEVDREADPMTSHLAACEQTEPPAFDRKAPIRGVRYNVIRRDCPIRRHKATAKKPEEGKDAFYKRLETDYFKANPEEWFMRWKVEVTPGDIARFRRECLDPILIQLCDWYEWVTNESDPFEPDVNGNIYHWRHPFGVYNVMDEGGSTDLDEYLTSGSMVGLETVDSLFGELQ